MLTGEIKTFIIIIIIIVINNVIYMYTTVKNVDIAVRLLSNVEGCFLFPHAFAVEFFQLCH